MDGLGDPTIVELGRALARRSVSAVELTRACLARIEATRHLGAFLRVDEAGALAEAEASDVRRAAGRARSALDGIPLALKDNLLTRGLVTTAGSRILEGFIPPYDATVVARLRSSGAVLLGKTSLDEFAMGSSTEHCAYGPARNPWDEKRVPGGSSGGSAVAVASRAAPGALGTDTGGSLRQPAAFCGLVGLKPTYGRVSRFGVIAFASSLDQVGPLTRDVRDGALLLSAIAGHDPRDATSARAAVPDYAAGLEGGVRGMTLGVPREYFVAGLDDEVRQSVERALEVYRRLGARVVDVSLPHTELAVATYYLIATAEASSNLARFDGVRYGLRRDPERGLRDLYLASRAQGFGPEVKRRILLGTFVLSAGYHEAYYGRAQKVRTLIREDHARALATVDALVTPTSPTVAFPLGARVADPLQMYLADVFTVSANLVGAPGLSMPCGRSAAGLPIGLQLLTPAWQEARLLQIARAYERETGGAA